MHAKHTKKTKIIHLRIFIKATILDLKLYIHDERTFKVMQDTYQVEHYTYKYINIYTYIFIHQLPRPVKFEEKTLVKNENFLIFCTAFLYSHVYFINPNHLSIPRLKLVNTFGFDQLHSLVKSRWSTYLYLQIYCNLPS